MEKILIIEDSHLLRLQVKKALEESGYTDIVELNSAELISKNPNLYLNNVALIILDIGLPVISGIDFANQLKNDSIYRSIPIMFISGNSESQMVHAAVEAGGKDYIAKPFKYELLVERIEKIMDTYYGKSKEKKE